MLRRIRLTRPRHATVVAYLALFVALGGSSYAALRIGSADIRDNSVRSRDLRNNEVRGKDIRNGTISGRDVGRNKLGGGAIKESSLGVVPEAVDAQRLAGVTTADLKLHCPSGTVAKAGVCFDSTPATGAFAAASTACASRGRRLPIQFELAQFAEGGGGVSPSGEWTASVFESRTTAGELDTVLVTNSGGEVFGRAGGATVRPYRCVASPTN